MFFAARPPVWFASAVIVALFTVETYGVVPQAVQGIVRDASGKPVSGALIYENRPIGDRTPTQCALSATNGRFSIDVNPPTTIGVQHDEFMTKQLFVDASSSPAKETVLEIELVHTEHATLALRILGLPVGTESDEALEELVGKLVVADDGMLSGGSISLIFSQLDRLRPYLLHYLSAAAVRPASGPYSPAELRAMQLLVYRADPEDAALARRWWSAVGRDAADRPPQLDGLNADIPVRPNSREAVDALMNVLNLRLLPYAQSPQGAEVDRLFLGGNWYGPRSSPSPFASRRRRNWDIVVRRTADGWDVPLYLHRKDDTYSLPSCIRF